MSFSQDTRDELMKHYSKQVHVQKAELAALLMIGSKGLAYDSESGKYIYTDVRSTDRNGFTANRKTFNINGVIDLGGDIEKLLSGIDDKRAFVRGAFIAAGTISNPDRTSHLEIAVSDEWIAQLLVEQLAEFDVNARITQSHGDRFLVYVKDSEGISMTLNVMGANKAMMEYENIHINRGLRGQVNRRVNCDTANINKAISAGAKQIEDIMLIDSVMGLDELEEGLREICSARLNNPDVSLTDLGELVSPKVSKSGANHRMRKISKIAESIRAKRS